MKENKILKWAMILSIVIVANLFFNYSLSLIFNSSNYEDICPYAEISKASSNIKSKESCEAQSGIWDKNTINKDAVPTAVYGYCDLNMACNNKFNELQKIYEKKVFATLFILGLLILIASFLIKKNQALSSALALTAVLNFIIASVRYWEYSDKLLKVALLLVVLAILIYMTIKKFGED